MNFNNKKHDEFNEWEQLTYVRPFCDNVENFSFNTPQLLRSIKDSVENIRLHSILVDSRIEKANRAIEIYGIGQKKMRNLRKLYNLISNI